MLPRKERVSPLHVGLGQRRGDRIVGQLARRAVPQLADRGLADADNRYRYRRIQLHYTEFTEVAQRTREIFLKILR
jgi:hypothetical protein